MITTAQRIIERRARGRRGEAGGLVRAIDLPLVTGRGLVSGS